jgi:hypothetical protein
MSRIVVLNHVTQNGVMQGPGCPDEDTRGGFHEVAPATLAAELSRFLLGRRLGPEA